MSQAPIEQVMRSRVLRLNAAVQGLALGVVTGLGLFIATNWLVLKGGPVVGPHLSLLGQFLIGYRVTFAGSLVGLAYGLVIGGLCGYAIASIYNRVVEWRERGAAPGGRHVG
jgi:hypothetical protein